MKRLINAHTLRPVVALDGFWDFVPDKEDRGARQRWFKKFPLRSERMAVPGCWDTKPKYFDYHGKGWYRRRVRLPQKGHALFTFEGTGGAATIYCDGRRIARSAITCLPYQVPVKNLEAGDHELIVAIDSSKKQQAMFPNYAGDWHYYSGLVRPVDMAVLGDVWIKKLHVHYSVGKGGVRLEPEVEIVNLGRTDRRETLGVELNGEIIVQTPVRLKAGKTTVFRQALAPRRLALWSPGKPALHMVRAACGGDDLSDRTGFRTIAVRKNRIFLNGTPLKILGVNRHHEYGDNGFAVPPDIVQRDFEIIKDMGCNAVRCHYPIDDLAMDFCDEMGLLVWSEIPFYGRWPAVVDNPAYLALAEQAVEGMVRRDYNRPSVFVWSVLNECATDIPKGARAAARLVRKVRSLDESRPVSYASNRLLKDKGFGLLDLIGLNAYPDWYDAKEFLSWPELIPAIRRKLRRELRRDLPLIVTETGGAGIYGDRSLEDRKWSERFQADLLAKHLAYLLKEPAVTGVFIWQFADIRTIREYWSNRPGTFNNKGLLDRFRRPKESYWRVKAIYQRFTRNMNMKLK